MKKLFLSLAVVSLVTLTACNNEAKKTDAVEGAPVEQTETTPAEGTGTTEATPAEAGATADAGIPEFKDKEVQNYVNEYTAFVKKYANEVKADPSKVAGLQKEVQEWATKSASAIQKLATDKDQLKLFQDYITKLGEEIAK